MENFLLALILLVAIAMRVFNLDRVPPSLFGDEVDVGYQAYSMLKTGQDLYGNSWPTIVHSLSEYRAPLFIYSTIPFVAIFGLNEWGVRLPASFWGVLGILGIFLLTKKLINTKVALASAVTLTISPWHIHYSRASFEVTMLLSFLIFGTLFFLKGLDKRSYLLFAALLFGLTPYIYSTAVVFMPLLLMLLIFIYRDKIINLRFNFLLAFLVLLICLAPYGWQTIKGSAGERFNVISIFTEQVLQDKVTLAQKATTEVGSNRERFFHNKPLIWAQVFSVNYLRSFSPEFLFLNGDPNFRHSIHEMGQMYFYELTLLLIGLWVLIKNQTNVKWLILGWLAIAPIPAALTFDGGFHATRAFLMLPPLMLIVGMGMNFIWENIRKAKIKYVGIFILILALFNITFYLHRYVIHYPKESWRAWHYGFKEAMQYVSQNKDNFEKVLINNTYEPSLIRFLFWSQYDPVKFHQQFSKDQPIKNITFGFDGFGLEHEQSSFSNKYFFGKANGPFEQTIKSNILYVASARDDITNPETLNDPRVRLLKTIYSPTGEPIFYIISGNQK